MMVSLGTSHPENQQIGNRENLQLDCLVDADAVEMQRCFVTVTMGISQYGPASMLLCFVFSIFPRTQYLPISPLSGIRPSILPPRPFLRIVFSFPHSPISIAHLLFSKSTFVPFPPIQLRHIPQLLPNGFLRRKMKTEDKTKQ